MNYIHLLGRCGLLYIVWMYANLLYLACICLALCLLFNLFVWINFECAVYHMDFIFKLIIGHGNYYSLCWFLSLFLIKNTNKKVFNQIFSALKSIKKEDMYDPDAGLGAILKRLFKLRSDTVTESKIINNILREGALLRHCFVKYIDVHNNFSTIPGKIICLGDETFAVCSYIGGHNIFGQDDDIVLRTTLLGAIVKFTFNRISEPSKETQSWHDYRGWYSYLETKDQVYQQAIIELYKNGILNLETCFEFFKKLERENSMRKYHFQALKTLNEIKEIHCI